LNDYGRKYIEKTPSDPLPFYKATRDGRIEIIKQQNVTAESLTKILKDEPVITSKLFWGVLGQLSMPNTGLQKMTTNSIDFIQN
jgi:hypothetical protein